MNIDIKRFPKSLFLFVLIFMINFIISKKHQEYYVFHYQSSDYEKATSIAVIFGSSATSFIIVGFIVFLISIIKWGITKKFKWYFSEWMLIIVFLLELIKLYGATL